MGTGAWFADGLQPAAFVKATQSPYDTLNGPNMALVRMKPGVSAAAGYANLEPRRRVGKPRFRGRSSRRGRG